MSSKQDDIDQQSKLELEQAILCGVASPSDCYSKVKINFVFISSWEKGRPHKHSTR